MVKENLARLALASALAASQSPGNTVYLPAVFRQGPPVVTTWVEGWNNDEGVQARWNRVGGVCWHVPRPGLLEMVCESQGLTSISHWDLLHNITVEGEVMGENEGPAQDGGTAFWAGLTLFDRHIINVDEHNDGKLEEVDDSRYAELTHMAWMRPGDPAHFPQIASLTNERYPYPGRGEFRTLQSAPPGSKHQFKIVYQAAEQQYLYYVDDMKKPVHQVPAHMLEDPNIFILCVAVRWNNEVVTKARAHCEFGPITVTGVRIP